MVVAEVVDLEGLILQVDQVDQVEEETLETMVMVETVPVILEVVAEVVVEPHQIQEEMVVLV